MLITQFAMLNFWNNVMHLSVSGIVGQMITFWNCLIVQFLELIA